jgi:hypothetical protein
VLPTWPAGSRHELALENVAGCSGPLCTSRVENWTYIVLDE